MKFKYEILRRISPLWCDTSPAGFEYDYENAFEFILKAWEEIETFSHDLLVADVISYIFFIARKDKKWRKDFCKENNIPEWRIIHLLDRNQKSKIPLSIFVNILSSDNEKYVNDEHVKVLLKKLFDQEREETNS